MCTPPALCVRSAVCAHTCISIPKRRIRDVATCNFSAPSFPLSSLLPLSSVVYKAHWPNMAASDQPQLNAIDRFLTKSKFMLNFYTYVVTTKNPFTKWLGLGLVCLICISRCWRVYLRHKLRLAAVLAGACVLAGWLGLGLLGVGCVALYLVCLLPTVRESLVHNAGHRVGAEGFDGTTWCLLGGGREWDGMQLQCL